MTTVCDGVCLYHKPYAIERRLKMTETYSSVYRYRDVSSVWCRCLIDLSNSISSLWYDLHDMIIHMYVSYIWHDHTFSMTWSYSNYISSLWHDLYDMIIHMYVSYIWHDHTFSMIWSPWHDHIQTLSHLYDMISMTYNHTSHYTQMSQRRLYICTHFVIQISHRDVFSLWYRYLIETSLYMESYIYDI